uniref:F-box domain-containing protein n=1 Tax=Tetranychus urticae TaxID=32264 RepID=T1K369_TETUR
MSIDKLPTEILDFIFDKLTELNDIVNCFQVCERWSYIIGERTHKVKYLIRFTFSDDKVYSKDLVYNGRTEPLDGSVLLKVFPNLRIADISLPYRIRKKYDISNLVLELLRNGKHIKGLIEVPLMKYVDIFKNRTALEMLCISRLPDEIPISDINESVKQLYTCSHPVPMSDFSKLIHFLPSLERLQAKIRYDNQDAGYDGPKLMNLKIAELDLRANSLPGLLQFGLELLDACPALVSAHVYAFTSAVIVEDTTKNENMRDLVLQFREAVAWHSQIDLLAKYPNLKHLALRCNLTLRDDHIHDILSTLPKLVLLDVRGSPRLTRRSARFVEDYCERHGRSIYFYFKKEDREQIEKDWPHLSTRQEIISRGFDFMANCFLKDNDTLPYFLDPMDD